MMKVRINNYERSRYIHRRFEQKRDVPEVYKRDAENRRIG